MQHFFLTSPSVSVLDSQGREISNVAVHDDTRLENYLLSAKLVGHPVHVEKVKKLIYTFIEYWLEGERRIVITYGNVTLTTFPVKHIDLEDGLIELGLRPVDPVAEVQSAVNKFAAAVNHKSPNATALYRELQNIIQKYPTLQIKEQA